MADGDADQVEVSTTQTDPAPPSASQTDAPSDVQGESQELAAEPAAEPAAEVVAEVDPLPALLAEVEALTGRLDMLEQIVHERLEEISPKLARIEGKLKHM